MAICHHLAFHCMKIRGWITFQTCMTGFFDGLWTSENKSAYLFLRTDTGGRSTLVLKDVERIEVSNFKGGNIILDVVFIDSGELTVEHIQQLYKFSDSGKAQHFLKEVQERGLRVLEVNPSYGADCTPLFRTAEILPGHVLPVPAVPLRT
jgi:hypothetical protein